LGRNLYQMAAGAILVAAIALLVSCAGQQAATPAAGAAGSGPRIVVDEEFFDFGKVPLDKVVSHTFRIKNAGGAPLVLAGEPKVRAAQGC
jgi:hypothetical protein